MSNGHSCPCQLNWLTNTLGVKRDPINSEKAWLDFAVRHLSREVVGKGRGQETVWNEKCKPVWWDKTVGLPWKNPTTNPKDSKEVLEKKYSALEHHLLTENRFPKELEEEAKLWNEGKVKGLFLQTTLSSLLGKVSSLHDAVLDACRKVNDMKAKVNANLVSDIKSCLNATLRATENLFITNNKVVVKRSCIQSGKENSYPGTPKSRKIDPVPSKLSAEKPANQNASSLRHTSAEIISIAQKLLEKRKREKCQAIKSTTPIFPKPPPVPFNSSVQVIPHVGVPVKIISSELLGDLFRQIASCNPSPNLKFLERHSKPSSIKTVMCNSQITSSTSSVDLTTAIVQTPICELSGVFCSSPSNSTFSLPSTSLVSENEFIRSMPVVQNTDLISSLANSSRPSLSSLFPSASNSFSPSSPVTSGLILENHSVTSLNPLAHLDSNYFQSSSVSTCSSTSSESAVSQPSSAASSPDSYISEKLLCGHTNFLDYATTSDSNTTPSPSNASSQSLSLHSSYKDCSFSPSELDDNKTQLESSFFCDTVHEINLSDELVNFINNTELPTHKGLEEATISLGPNINLGFVSEDLWQEDGSFHLDQFLQNYS